MDATPPPAAEPKKLYRSKTNRMLAGVCGGMAEHFGMDATLLRLIWAFGSLFFAVIGGVLVYVVCAVVIPERP